MVDTYRIYYRVQIFKHLPCKRENLIGCKGRDLRNKSANLIFMVYLCKQQLKKYNQNIEVQFLFGSYFKRSYHL